MQRALQQEWTFIQRAIPNIANLFSGLEKSIHTSFFHNLFGKEIPTHYTLKRSYGTAIYYTSYGTVVFVEHGRDDDRVSNYAFI